MTECQECRYRGVWTVGCHRKEVGEVRAEGFAAGVEAAAAFLETSVDPTVEGHLAAEQIRARVARPTTLEET